MFPKHAGIYNADGDGYDSGAEFNKLGPIFSDSHGVYVSPELQPGLVSEHLACENRFGTVLSHFTLHIKLVRSILTHYRSKLSPTGAFQTLMPGLNGIDAGGLGSYVFVSVPACRDPKTLLTLTSLGLVPSTIASPNHDLQGDRDIGRRGSGGEPGGVVEQDLVGADLNEQRRQAREISEDGADERVGRVMGGRVVAGAGGADRPG